MRVGIRELKANLSEFVERAASGEIIEVTSRGRGVAQLVPLPGRGNLEQGLAEGWLVREENSPPRDIVPVRPRAGADPSAEVLRADRDR